MTKRLITYLNEKYPNTTWGKQFKQLLYDAMHLNKKTKSQALEHSKIIAQLDQILHQPPDKNHKEVIIPPKMGQ